MKRTLVSSTASSGETAVVWAIANLTFLRDERGRPLNWVGQFQDITALRRAPAPE